MLDEVRFMSLGGLSDVGCKNCYALLYKGKAYLFDCGQEIPDGNEEFNPSRHVPDFSLLIGKVSEVVAIVISHPHLDHIGALGEFRVFYETHFPDKPMPAILVSDYSARVIRTMETFTMEHWTKERRQKEKVPEHKRVSEFLKVVQEYQTLRVGDAELFFFPVIHSTPGSRGCSVNVGAKRVVYLGDFKGQGLPEETRIFERDLEKPEVRSPDVLLLDATGADKEGISPSDYDAFIEVARVIRDNNHGRILVALFASHAKRVESIAYLVAKQTQRPVYINGRSLFMYTSERITESGILRNLLKYPQKRWHERVPYDAVIFVTGAQGEPNAVLNRLERLYPHRLHLGSNDAVIFSASTIPGNEPDVEVLLEKLSATGCTIYLPTEPDGSPHRLTKHAGKNAVSGMFHVSGHGHREDLERTVGMIGPRKIIPVHAGQSRRARVRDLFPDRQVLVLREHEEVVL